MMKQGIPIVAAVVFAMSGAAFAASGGGNAASNQPKAQAQGQGSGASVDLDPETIRKVQRALHQAGYNPGPVNGSWNQASGEALVNWQKANGLDATGKVDQQTLNKLGIPVAKGGAAGGGAPESGAGSSKR